ncbi:protein MpLTP-like73 [Marchantia polymorpha subsp. ruderalis]|uniref:Bifunctional inhibitor/plant lipid transfer protein/seed storage helical domain-containing protein n=2 Tax=Marchantia polymorpha TaxID=3197 RepID=A0A176VKP0_MARPO|nr:hypothetical protein AXG93_2116s1460 [Marchantia polymorpha subsp. ruderalis]PTQ33498.1 hypothetical protein MARPO_0088s0044 [Marchantia polymorpha]BBN15972.1 hypothetical protein Mp_7g02420 [Marchantia polymorpha subsp. ruderalis]|eukprot:PTQ33498.1 hypothetical protein MARPO_0088s0044 [Marchantia polymorpha]
MAVKRLQLLVLCLLATVVVASAFPLHWPGHGNDHHKDPHKKSEQVDDKKDPDCDKPTPAPAHETPKEAHHGCSKDSKDPKCMKDEQPKHEEKPKVEEQPKHEEKPKVEEHPKQEEKPKVEEHPKQEEKPKVQEYPKEEKKCDHCGKDSESKPVTKPAADRCGPLAHWHSCAHYVQDNVLFKGPHKKFAPRPHFHSLCCNQVRSESVDCMCKAVNAKYAYGHFVVDMERAAMLPKWCKKVVPHGSKCNGKDVIGYVQEDKNNGYGHGKPGHYGSHY